MANDKTMMFYGLFCLSKPNETACAHVLYTDVIICIFSMFAAVMYLVGDQVSIINLLMSIAGNGFMILNSIIVRKSIPVYAARCIAVSGTRCYRFIRVILYLLSIANTIFPVVSITRGRDAKVDDSSDGKALEELSTGLKNLIIICIVFDFLTSVWGLSLAIPFNVAVVNLDESKRSRIFPAGYFQNQDNSQFDDSVQDFQPDPHGYGYRPNYNPIRPQTRVFYGQPPPEVPMRAEQPPELQVIDVKQGQSVPVQNREVQINQRAAPVQPPNVFPDVDPQGYDDEEFEEAFDEPIEPKPYQRPVI